MWEASTGHKVLQAKQCIVRIAWCFMYFLKVLLTCPFLQIWVFLMVCNLVLPCISMSGWIWIVLPQVFVKSAQSCFVQLMPQSVRILFFFLYLVILCEIISLKLQHLFRKFNVV